MNLKPCYDALGSDYEEVRSRFYKEEILQKLVLMFLDDPSFEQLTDAMQKHDHQTAFRMAHTIKGFCMNLGFPRLQASASALTEALRSPGHENDAESLYQQVKRDYEETYQTIVSFFRTDSMGGMP